MISLSLSMWTRTELRRMGVQTFQPGTRSTQIEDLHCMLWCGYLQCMGIIRVSVTGIKIHNPVGVSLIRRAIYVDSNEIY